MLLCFFSGKARVADEILRHFHEVKSVLPLLEDVSRHLSHQQVKYTSGGIELTCACRNLNNVSRKPFKFDEVFQKILKIYTTKDNS